LGFGVWGYNEEVLELGLDGFGVMGKGASGVLGHRA
jgi:hypothetical protein